MSRSITTVSAYLIVYLNGVLFGRVTDFTYSSQTTYAEKYGIDQSEPSEFTPTITRLSGSCSFLKTYRDGGLEGAGIAARFEDITRQKYISIMILDRSTDTVVFQCDRAVCDGQTMNMPNRGIVTGSFQFKGFTWNNDAKFRT